MKVAIIGQGYVGLTISVFAAEHHTVVGFDMNKGVVEALNSGRSQSSTSRKQSPSIVSVMLRMRVWVYVR